MEQSLVVKVPLIVWPTAIGCKHVPGHGAARANSAAASHRSASKDIRFIVAPGGSIDTVFYRAKAALARAVRREGTITSRSTPDSAPHASPARPSICRTWAFARVDGKLANFSVSGSNLTMALVVQSVSHTLSFSSTHTE